MTNEEPSTHTAKDVFLDALEHPVDRRESFLEQACAGDEALLARVRKLLAAHEQSSTLQTPESIARAAVSLVDLNPGDRVGPYELRECLGEGGFGVVFRAEQQEPLRRDVALKVVKLGMDTREVIARFETERAVLARMAHASIAQVFDAGTTEAGRPYFVMELVDGAPIVDYCDRHGLGTRERIELLHAVCMAVQHAHQKGVIHRDLKPTNVLIAEVDGVAIPKVIDFGIAKAAGDGSEAKSLDLTGGRMIGTPAYMSPEQIDGSADVDTRADVYALGALLYELLAGAPPFEIEGVTLGELQQAIRDDDPPRPSTRRRVSIERSRATPAALGEVPADLDWIVLRCLEKEPSRRYSSASALADDIERFLNDLPVEAAPPGFAYTARKLARRHKVATLAGLAVLLSLLLGIAGTSVGLVQSEQARSELTRALARETELTRRALDAEAVATREAATARAVNEFLTDDLLASAAPSTEAGRGLEVRMRDVLDGAAGRIERAAGAGGRLADKPEVVAAVVETLGNTYAALGGYVDALPHLERTVAMRTELLGPEDPATLRAASRLGHAITLLGRAEEGLALLAETLAAQQRVLGGPHRDTVETLSHIVLAHQSLDRDADAERAVREALEMADGILSDHDPLRGRLLIVAGLQQFRRRNLDRAERLFMEALENFLHNYGEIHEQTLVARQNLGAILLFSDSLERAEPMLRQALEVSRELLGADHPGTLVASQNLADVLRSQERYEEAIPLQKAAYEGYIRSFGENHRATWGAVNVYGTICLEAGRFDESVRAFRENAPMADDMFGATDPFATNTWRNLAQALHLGGEHGEAAEILEVLLTRETVAGVETAGVTRERLALCLRDMGRVAEAEALFDAR